MYPSSHVPNGPTGSCSGLGANRQPEAWRLFCLGVQAMRRAVPVAVMRSFFPAFCSDPPEALDVRSCRGY
ncbi:hypothetical protein A9O63_06590 [Cereibacter johrii]|nr:hypothetical protein A9O63_06590 [Cereibacter johrii]